MGKLYTCDEVAERYQVKPATVLSWIREKKLCAIKICGSKIYRIAEEDLIAFEDARRTIKKETT